MTVKLIAVDMDGTFLSSEKEYNRERFAKIYTEILKQEVKFVVASGNQYYQLRSFFPEIEKDITFVAENGALIVNQREKLFVGEIPAEVVAKTLAVIERIPGAMTIICGEKSAYIPTSEEKEFFLGAKEYYHRLAWVENVGEIDDKIIKFALNFAEEEVPAALAALEAGLEGALIPVSSGHGSIDLITPGTHKAHGIELLQERWKIPTEAVAVFGDSGNDLEMVKHAGKGFAMKNAAPAILAVADHITEFDNENEGVLVEMERLLGLAK